jgi:nickel/cobalt transporter (NicO) family protein
MDIAELIRQGSSSLLILLPMALALGALHGLEPGHSKTMMAAFIIAVKGTPAQAALLGLSATLSHTAIVWIIGLGGLYLGQNYVEESFEPWLKGISAVVMIGVGLWMLWQTHKSQKPHSHHDHDHHGHDHHPHDHSHDHGHDHGHHHHHDDHPHDDKRQDDKHRAASAVRAVAHDHHHDAHAAMHAREIETKFASGTATTGQIILFGLTGGLIPCPASITVLLLCLQLKQVALGAWLVLGFSIGLAATLVAVGVGASLAMKGLALKGLSGRFGDFEQLAAKAPYLSAIVILGLGLFMGLGLLWGGH